MPPEVIALVSAMGWAGDAVLVRIGARTSNIYAAAFMSYSVAAALFWGYLLAAYPLNTLWSPALIYFVLSGCLQPLLARILYYIAITRLGAARAGSLRGISPVFALIIAVIFLGERPALPVYIGTFLVVASVWLLSWRDEQGGEWRLFDIFFPLAAAFVAAMSQNLRRGGLLILPDPYVGAAVTTSTSLALFTASLAAFGRLRVVVPGRASLPFFACAALLSAFAQVLNFAALSMGEVSVMVPLLDTTPLFILLFSALFLRDVEKVTGKIFAGTILMVAGVAIISSR
jgi:uncharacterized membrane protein